MRFFLGARGIAGSMQDCMGGQNFATFEALRLWWVLSRLWLTLSIHVKICTCAHLQICSPALLHW